MGFYGRMSSGRSSFGVDRSTYGHKLSFIEAMRIIDIYTSQSFLVTRINAVLVLISAIASFWNDWNSSIDSLIKSMNSGVHTSGPESD